jgi:excisionase family DNA binding protein
VIAAELALKISQIFDDARRQVLELLVQSQQTPNRDTRLKAKEVAAILNVPKSKVYEMRRDGRLPADVDLGEDYKDHYRWLPSTIYSFTGNAPSDSKKGEPSEIRVGR